MSPYLIKEKEGHGTFHYHLPNAWPFPSHQTIAAGVFQNGPECPIAPACSHTPGSLTILPLGAWLLFFSLLEIFSDPSFPERQAKCLSTYSTNMSVSGTVFVARDTIVNRTQSWYLGADIPQAVI